MLLDETYDFLRNVGIVKSESEFSEEWLGRGECYMRTLRFKNAHPSIGSIAVCAVRLQKAGEQLKSTNRYRQIGLNFIAMSEKLTNHVNEDGIEFELAD